jgi:hypothetical protein
MKDILKKNKSKIKSFKGNFKNEKKNLSNCLRNF